MFGRKAKAENARLKAQYAALLELHSALVIDARNMLVDYSDLKRQLDEARALINPTPAAYDVTASNAKRDTYVATGKWTRPEHTPVTTVEIISAGQAMSGLSNVVSLDARRGK